MHDENYLIICRSDYESRLLLERVVTYMFATGYTNIKIHKAHRVITATVPNVIVRFTSQARVHEDCRGFRGTIRMEYEVNKFLDHWERSTYKKEGKQCLKNF